MPKNRVFRSLELLSIENEWILEFFMPSTFKLVDEQNRQLADNFPIWRNDRTVLAAVPHFPDERERAEVLLQLHSKAASVWV